MVQIKKMAATHLAVRLEVPVIQVVARTALTMAAIPGAVPEAAATQIVLCATVRAVWSTNTSEPRRRTVCSIDLYLTCGGSLTYVLILGAM